MKRLTILLLWFAAVLPLAAQTAHRDSVLAQARYLKSIYRTDEAIELPIATSRAETWKMPPEPTGCSPSFGRTIFSTRFG